jgi:hypothetical protein
VGDDVSVVLSDLIMLCGSLPLSVWDSFVSQGPKQPHNNKEEHSRIIRTTPRIIRVRLIRRVLLRCAVSRERLLHLRTNVVGAVRVRDLRIGGADQGYRLVLGRLSGGLACLEEGGVNRGMAEGVCGCWDGREGEDEREYGCGC